MSLQVTQKRYNNYHAYIDPLLGVNPHVMIKTLPTITILRDSTHKKEEIFETDFLKLATAKWLYREAKVGTVILYDHVAHLEYHGHCLDFIIKRTEEGWQPYVSSFDIDDKRPLEYHLQPGFFTELSESLIENVKQQIERLEL